MLRIGPADSELAVDIANWLPAALPALLQAAGRGDPARQTKQGPARRDHAVDDRPVLRRADRRSNKQDPDPGRDPLDGRPRGISVVGADRDGALALLRLDLDELVKPDVLRPQTEVFARTDVTPVFLGPRIPQGATDAVILPLPEPRDDGAERAPGPAEIGIVDAGIAFWNPAFGESFATFGTLTPGTGTSLLSELPASRIDAMRVQGHDRAGDRKNRAELASRFPESVYAPQPGRAPALGPDARAHGTAMSDLVHRTVPGARLHGLELPISVLRDATGGALRGLLDAALRAVVLLAARQRADRRPFRMVVLLAYGFPGGPQDGPEPEVLARLRGTLAAFAGLGIEVDVVLPMGNHLQDQAYARLPVADGDTTGLRRLDWRLLSDDHSANTVELVHGGGVPALTLRAPDGATATRTADMPFAILCRNGRPIGALLTTPLPDGRARTRITLAATAARDTIAARTPPGRWRLELAEGGDLRAWVLRDDSGFEDDRSAPYRRSWFEDPHYRARDERGLPGRDDTLHPESAVRRAGSVSLLALSSDGAAHPVAAGWRMPDGTVTGAVYSGLYPPGHPRQPETVVIETPGPFAGHPALGNGSARPFRVSGTSVAAALHVGRLADPGGP